MIQIWGTGGAVRDFAFMAAPYWRAVARGSHQSFYTSSEEPPLSNFNSYRDIPGSGVMESGQSSTDGGIHKVSHVYRLDCHCANL